MNLGKSLGVLATLREVTELLAGLDLTTLEQISTISVTPDIDLRTLSGRAQLSVYGRDVTDLDRINAVRAWALALGGVTLLADEYGPATGRPYRELAAVMPLASGGVFEVWTHLHDLRPAPDSDLIAA